MLKARSYVDQCDCVSRCSRDGISVDRHDVGFHGLLDLSVDLGNVGDLGDVVFTIGGR